jgi:tRNA(Ile2)-agmatinylcytidine synthase
MIRPLEPIECTQAFETNHATDAHLRGKDISNVRPYDCVILSGHVTKGPKTIKGGHVVFELSDSTGSIDCAAYKPTGPFRIIASQLAVGDGVKVSGGIGKYPKTLNLEKIEIKSLADLPKLAPLTCCGRKMTSAGKNKGLKCKKCSKKISLEDVKVSHESRSLSLGVYNVPAGARRHLSKPTFLYPATYLSHQTLS